ncbi:MAG TPA: hypothetical protein PLL69_10865 [Gemmatimonadales bacterium]|nr:hypothetical protein [Gemmatimonadales bacterium]
MSDDRHRISLDDALVMVRRAREAALLPVHGWRIGGGIIREILAQDGAEGLRVYLGLGDDGVPTLVFMAADDQGADMPHGVLAELTWPCPPFCDDTSPFNRSE